MRRQRAVDAVSAAQERCEGVEIVYCDNHVLVAVKPPNMPSQADASGDCDLLTLMKAYVKQKYQKPGNVYLGLVHRLDRPVGGLMAFARTSKAAARLSQQLRTHAMRREYLCVVQGEALEQARLADVLEYDDGAAKEAVLCYERLEAREGLSLLRVRLETGRKHQIRRQLQHAGLPLWGDARYGNGRPGQQIALWGARLLLTHPTSGAALTFTSLPPQAFPWQIFAHALFTDRSPEVD